MKVTKRYSKDDILRYQRDCILKEKEEKNRLKNRYSVNLTPRERRVLKECLDEFGEQIPFAKIKVPVPRLREIWLAGVLTITKAGHFRYNMFRKDQNPNQYLEAVSGKMGNEQRKRWVRDVVFQNSKG